MIKPALRRGWRDRRTVQFGATPAHAVVLGPVDTATGSFLSLLDGTRGLPLLRKEAAGLGLREDRVDELLRRLGAAGLLDDRAPGRGRSSGTRGSSAVPDRLLPDLASLSLVHPDPGAAARRLAARGEARVQVRGAGRVGSAVAATLSAAGVGRVDVMDGGCVEPWDTGPGGLPGTAAGERRDAAAGKAVRAAAPGRRTRRTGAGAGPEARDPEGGLALTVLAPRDGLAAHAPDPAVAEPLLSAGIPHLYAGVLEGTGVVGPLVLPGESACAGCVQELRAEQDPGRPRLLAQWRSGSGPAAVPACDIALATVVAGLAAAHALSFLDGRPPVSAGARLEFTLPDLAWEAQPVPPHPECGCGAAGAAERPYSWDGGVPPRDGPVGAGLGAGVAGSSPPEERSGVGGAHV